VFQTNIKHIIIQRLLSMPFRGSGFIGMSLANLIFPKLTTQKQVSTLYGFDIIVHGQDDGMIERTIYYTGTYEKGTLHLLGLLLGKGSVFVDAGANIGLMSLFAAQRVGPLGCVHAFEPFPKIFNRLQANILLNHYTNIKTYPLALASDDGNAFLYPDTNNNPGASSLIKRPSSKNGIAVEKKTADQMLNGTSIDVFKIDVEGYEMEVLKGASQLLNGNNAPALIVECSNERENFGYTSEDLFNFIRTVNRYRIFKLKRGKRYISQLVEIQSATDLPEHDNLFCMLPHHLNRVLNG
jgi:FkbM family methyltransferase